MAQSVVAGLVAERVVVVLEPGEIAEHEAVAAAVALGPRGKLDEVLFQSEAVGDTGERVAARFLSEAVVDLA